MKKIVIALALLYPVAALAQGAKPAAPNAAPMVGDKPLVQVGKKTGAKKKPEPAAKQPSESEKLQACLEIEDASKERLNCFDAIHAPQPKPKPAAAKKVADCRFVKEEDERLNCYNGFAEKLAKPKQ